MTKSNEESSEIFEGASMASVVSKLSPACSAEMNESSSTFSESIADGIESSGTSPLEEIFSAEFSSTFSSATTIILD